MIVDIENKFISKIERLRSSIGNTPMRKFELKNPNVTLGAKLEWVQAGESVKARAAYFIFKNAIEKGLTNESRYLLDASSGNTAIAYATIGSRLGIPVLICLPENASSERKQILFDLGAEIEFTSPFESTDGAQLKAKEIASLDPQRYYYADQYSNEYNWKAHYYTTAEEIWEQTDGKITHFAVGMGTTGTIMGTAKRLKELNPHIIVIGFQPEIALHGLEGWKDLKTANVPSIYDEQIVDEIRVVKTGNAYGALVRLAKEEGLLISPSSAANYFAAKELGEELEDGYVVTVFPDNADKYSEVINKLI